MLQEWSNSYPNNVKGVVGARFMAPERLAAFNAHCARISAGAKTAIYMNCKGLQI